MYIIVGLGNPESKYNGTRHNIGFSAITALADANNISLDMKKHKALCGKGVIAGQKVLLAEPLTYMNLSGESVRELVDYYKVDPTDELIIIYDDINLAPGKLRIREKGSAGGHNGIKNIIAHLGSQDISEDPHRCGREAKRLGSCRLCSGAFRQRRRTGDPGSIRKSSTGV